MDRERERAPVRLLSKSAISEHTSRIHLTQYMDQMALESQLPDEIVNLLFTIRLPYKGNDFVGVFTFSDHLISVRQEYFCEMMDLVRFLRSQGGLYARQGCSST